jgi:sarcosine oxidase
MSTVDVAVIGRGLIGSAAARHLAEGGVTTALVGPREPADRKASEGPFSSHADQGRITRIVGRGMVWAELAARSIRRYGDIEDRSGVPFHTRCGLAVARSDLDDWIDAGLIMGSNVRKVDHDWLRQMSGIEIASDVPVAYEGGAAGHIDPRRMVAAQSKLTELAGATVIEEAATSVTPIGGGFEIGGPFGSLSAERVLLATGAFGRQLLGGAELDLELRPRTIALIEMDATSLPCLILAPSPDERLDEIYWVPPIRYPDGRICLKVGGEPRWSPVIGPGELVDWFGSDGDPGEAEALEAAVRVLLPGIEPVSVPTAPCVVTATPTGLPYIGWVGDGIAVALGGNGSAAKSSDELGRLAASLFGPDGWTDSLEASLFMPRVV